MTVYRVTDPESPAAFGDLPDFTSIAPVSAAVVCVRCGLVMELDRHCSSGDVACDNGGAA